MVHYASVVKERRLTCAEAVRTTKYIADNRVNIFKQFVPRSVRWSLFSLPRIQKCVFVWDALRRRAVFAVT